MKKLIRIFLIVILVLLGTKLFATQNFVSAKEIKKDPKLIELKTVKSIDSNLYNKKNAKDLSEYNVYKKQIGEKYFNLYKIFDKLLRANNLYHQEWKIIFIDDSEYGVEVYPQINSYTIFISLSAYEKLSKNEDLLAFLLSHELGHYVNNELISFYQDERRIKRILDTIFISIVLPRNTTIKTNLGSTYNLNSFNGMRRHLMLNNRLITLSTRPELKKLYKETRKMDYKADIEALFIMTRAGYSISYADYALELLSDINGFYKVTEEYKKNKDRIENVKKYTEIMDLDEIKNEGKNYLYRQEVLKGKMLSDGNTILIEKPSQKYKLSYHKENYEDLLMRKAYFCYLNDDLSCAKKYFGEAHKVNPSNYIALLYLSYVYELEYKNIGDAKSLRYALYCAKKAHTLKSTNKDTIKQKEDVTILYNELNKKEK